MGGKYHGITKKIASYMEANGLRESTAKHLAQALGIPLSGVRNACARSSMFDYRPNVQRSGTGDNSASVMLLSLLDPVNARTRDAVERARAAKLISAGVRCHMVRL